MVMQRASILARGLARTSVTRAGPASRSRSWRQVGRRSYASGHGEQQSSELPWIIGSIAVTVPAAGWLLTQGPTKSDHGHDDHGEKHDEPKEAEEQEEKSDDESEEKSEDKSDEKSEDKSEDKEDGEQSEEKDDEDKQEDDKSSKEESGEAKKGGKKKGPGEGQKGERAPSESKGEKDSQGETTGAKHPYLDDPEKSKKGLGVTDTAKIHGTVDPKKPARGPNTNSEK